MAEGQPALGDKPPHPAHPAHPAHPHGNQTPKAPKGSHPVAYKAKGTIKAIDPATEKLTVTVGSRPGDTNAHARSWAGNDVSFDLNGAI